MSRLKLCLLFLLSYARSCPRSVVRLIKNRRYWDRRETYFPEVSHHKSSFKIFVEQLCCVLRHGEINDFYFLYGFDVKKRKEQKAYVQHCDFRLRRNLKNFKPFNELCILRDKELFAIFGQAYGLPVLKTLGVLKDGVLIGNDMRRGFFEDFDGAGDRHLFFKPLNAECGEGVFSLDYVGKEWIKNGKIKFDGDECKAFIRGLGGREYLVQDRLIQHEEMSRLYPNSVNTIRIITIKDQQGKPQFFNALLRVGANGNVVDNCAKGGLLVGIRDNGFLGEEGFFKPPYGKKTMRHPDSGVVFKEFKIPYYKEAIQNCLSFHQKLKGVHAIGWDVAITGNGPVFIEGNDNFEISSCQALYKGYKKEIYHLFGK